MSGVLTSLTVIGGVTPKNTIKRERQPEGTCKTFPLIWSYLSCLIMNQPDQDQDNATSSDNDTTIYSSDEEILDADDDHEDEESNRAKANDIIATILEESDKLEQNAQSPRMKTSGKQKMSKEESVRQDFWKLISEMQCEINSLKRSRQTESSAKKPKIDVDPVPCSSGYKKTYYSIF